LKFITDSNLGKLAKWLRILGYDTTYYTENIDRNFLRMAQQQGRVVLTRKKDMARRQFSGQLFVIQHDHVKDQLEEVINRLSLVPEPEKLLTICLTCNEELKTVSGEEVSGMVPEYIFRCHKEFNLCLRCGGIFWPGTHRENIDTYLMTHTQRRHP
jgi:uncharacterized protein with PIN domain